MTSMTPFKVAPWVRRLLVINVAVTFLQATLFTGPTFIQALGFVPSRVLTQPWTALTYMFVHGSLWHLAFNMLILFMFGSAVEERMGSRRFIWFYLFSGVGGAVLSISLALMGAAAGDIPIVGASGAIYGVAFAFAWYWPDAKIFVFPLPVPVKAKWLVAFLVTMSLVSQIFGAQDGTAHLAHIGGFLFALLFLKFQSQAPERSLTTLRRPVPTKVLVHPAAERAEVAEAPPTRSAPNRQQQQAEIDRLLDKISEHGIDSLTPEERKVLMDASQNMRN